LPPEQTEDRSKVRMVSYQGEKVALRPLRPSDATETVAWRNDPEVRDNALGHRFPVTEKMEDGWIERALDDRNRSRVIYAIEDRADGALVGFVQLRDIDWINRNADFGIVIGNPSRRGRGLAREALALMVDHAFSALNLHRISLRVAAYNRIAIKLYEGFGFSTEGQLRQHVFLDDRYHDLLVMGLLREEFLAGKDER